MFIDPRAPQLTGTQIPSRTSNAQSYLHSIPRSRSVTGEVPYQDSGTIILETSEDVTGGAASEFTIITGITPALTVDTIAVSDNTITLNLGGTIPDGESPTVTYAASAGTVTDLATNPLADYYTMKSLTGRTLPRGRLIISFTTTSIQFTQGSPPSRMMYVFSESVTGFDDTDGISVTGTSGGTAANIPTGSAYRAYDLVL